MIELVLDHLWQSTLALAVAGLLTVFLANNSASIRYGIWLSASLKFLFPFTLLTAAGRVVSSALSPPFVPPIITALGGATEPFSRGSATISLTSPAFIPASSWDWETVLALIWFAGFALITTRWLHHWLHLRGIARAAIPIAPDASLPVKSSPSVVEPGLVGIYRTVLLLPAGVASRLSPRELDSIVAHEVCHWRRRDNLTAALHMVVEAIFWFYPLVWWLETRLIAERERACDEHVIAMGCDPEVYAESILKICKFYVRSPLACASGVSGGDLKKRIERIMVHPFAVRLGRMKKATLLAAAAVVLGVPMAVAMFPSSVPCDFNCTPANPATADALRRFVEAWERHEPDFSALTPGLAQSFTKMQDQVQREIDNWGALKSIAFQGAGPGGGDLYLATFANGLTTWQIGPLTANGRIAAMRFSANFIRANRTKPSPGTKAALRRMLDGWERHQPAVAAMSQALVAVTSAQRTNLQRLFDDWGACKSIAFVRVDANGMDEYDVSFEHGRSIFSIGPLNSDGKITDLVLDPAFTHAASGPSPSVESFLLGEIMSLENGSLDHSQMTPNLDARTSHDMPMLLAWIKQWGDLKTLRFRGVATNGVEIYDLNFAHGQAEWRVAPLTADGKAQQQVLSLYQGNYLKDR